MATILAISDAERLAELESAIARGLTTFVEVGAALAEIRDARLYRETHGTFEDYCRERWQMSRPRAYQLIDAAGVVAGLSTNVDTVPTSESQVRPLTKLEPEKQREAWSQAVATAPEGKVTAAHVKATVEKMTDETAATEPEEDMQATQTPRRGARLSLPAGKNAEDLLREGMELEGTGASAEEVAEVVGMGADSYRKARYLILLADRADLSPRDRQTVADALHLMNAEAVIRPAFEAVESLVERIYGSAQSRATPARAEAIRRANFDRAYGTLIQACEYADAIELPHLSPEEVNGVLAELKAAAQHVSTLRRRIEEEYR